MFKVDSITMELHIACSPYALIPGPDLNPASYVLFLLFASELTFIKTLQI